MIITLMVLCLIAGALTVQSARDLDQLRRELQRHEEGSAIRARVLAEQAKAVRP